MNLAEFTDHMWKLNTHGITLTAVCLGNELGLFNLLMGENAPRTSEALADKANMKERYVREWLGCMVASDIVKLENDEYFIPPERHATIKAATAWGYAVVSWVERFDKTKACFQKDGPWGHDYDLDDKFWTFFGGFRAVTGDGFLQDSILPTLEPDFVGRLESGSYILDLGCGTGAFAVSLAQKYPKSSVIGLDACDKPLKTANESQQKHSLSNLKFIKGDAHKLDEEMTKKFDLVFLCDCLHDLPNPKKALTETYKVLKDDGKLVIIEVRPHSKQTDNAGDMTVAMFYSCSIFSCLQCSMQFEPRIGYGACWGQEDMTKAIEDVFQIEKKVELPMLHAIYICRKKEQI